jgi:aryl-alcohol dehydrogenase (NADP+)
MEHRHLGNSGLRVSPLCLGTLTFADRTDEATARSIIALARDAGVNFLDTADVYVGGRSEELVGKLISDDRANWVLGTKVGEPLGKTPNRGGLGRKWLMQSIDESLRRLGTDYVDIYYLHLEDPSTPMEETVIALGDIIRQGKARFFGISNYSGWRIAHVVALCDRLGIQRPAVCQPHYNAFSRGAEIEVLPACQHYGIGIAAYSPLGRGVLTGKYQPGAAAPVDSRVGRDNKRIMVTDYRKESLDLAQTLRAHAEKRGRTAVQVALKWVLNNRLVQAVVAGPRSVEQWRDYLDALDAPFDAEDEALINELVAAGHTSTPGWTDPAQPVLGRVPRVA